MNWNSEDFKRFMSWLNNPEGDSMSYEEVGAFGIDEGELESEADNKEEAFALGVSFGMVYCFVYYGDIDEQLDILIQSANLKRVRAFLDASPEVGYSVTSTNDDWALLQVWFKDAEQSGV